MIVTQLYKSYSYNDLIKIGTRYCVPVKSTLTDNKNAGSFQRFAYHVQARQDGRYKIFYIDMADVINKALGLS